VSRHSEPQRILDPVQDPEAEHNVEPLRGIVQRKGVAPAVLHARAEQVGDRREALASLQLDRPARAHPRHVLLVVDGDHMRRAAVLGEEGVEGLAGRRVPRGRVKVLTSSRSATTTAWS
jgi:hypothetical protein